MKRHRSSVVDIIVLLILLGLLLACTDGNQDSIDLSKQDDPSNPEIFETSVVIRDGDGNETDSFLPGETLYVSIHLTNMTEEPQTWQFSSGQFFDVEVFDKNDQHVWTWSDGKLFTQDTPVITFSPFETKTYMGEWDQSTKEGAQAEPGAYYVYACSRGCYGQRKGPYPIMIANDPVEVYISDGAIQCEFGGYGLAETEMLLEDGGINVLFSQCAILTDVSVSAQCGLGDVNIHIHTIENSRLADAADLGFFPVSSLETAFGPGYRVGDCGNHTPDGTMEEFIWETKGGGNILFSIIRNVHGFQIGVEQYDFQTVDETFILSTADLEVYGIVEDIFNNVIDLNDYAFIPEGETGTWTTITLIFSDDQEITIGNIQAWRDKLSVLYDFVKENTEQLLACNGFGCGNNSDSVQGDQYNNPDLDLSTNHLYDYDQDNTSWPYPDNEAGNATIEGMRHFFSFIQDHFKASNLSVGEAEQVYMALEKHKEYFDGSIYFHDESYGMPSPEIDIPDYQVRERVLIKKIDESTYEIFFSEIGCGKSFYYMKLIIQNNEITEKEYLEIWWEVYPC